MVCGRRPFVGDDALELTAAILNASPLPLPAKVPVGLRDVITRCLGQDPEARFQRATDVNAALCACRVSDRPVAFTGRRRRRAMVALSLAAALLVGAFALYRWRAGPSTRATHSGPVTLAVVPFQIPSAGDDIAFFGIAVPDGIISRLAPVKSIRVRA